MFNRIFILLLAAASFLSAPVFAQSAAEPLKSGSTVYVTGGIGDEEREALASVRNNYNFHATSSDVAGAFEGDTHIVIRNSKGESVLDVNDAGPIFFAQLPAGTYTVEASNEEQVRKMKITLAGKKSVNAHFAWKEEPVEGKAVPSQN